MKNLQIQGDFKSPSIDFNAESKELKIFGRSWPENAISTYASALTWIDDYFKSNNEAKVVFQLEYFNTSSSKIILDILNKLEEYHTAGKKISIQWYYETDDDDLKEDGEIMKESSKMPFELVGIEEFEFTFQ